MVSLKKGAAPVTDDDLCFADIATLAGLFRERRLSPVEFLEIVLRRIERTEPLISAYIAVDREGARAAAKAAETAFARNDGIGPLSGIPVAVKDMIDVRGLPTTNGSHAVAVRPAEHDADAVAGLRKAGAVMLGKANTHEYGLGATTESVFKQTRNPWDIRRIASGSSGGSAAAVAAGAAVLGLATDAGGSIRAPAAWCGIAGIRPTPSLIDEGGVTILCPGQETLGPMARRSRDLIPALRAIANTPPGDARPTKDVRIAVPLELFQKTCDGEVVDALDRVVAWARRRGLSVQVLAWEPAVLENGRTAMRALGAKLAAEALPESLWDRLGPAEVGRLRFGRSLTDSDMVNARRQADRLRAEITAVLSKADAILLPGCACDPPEVGSSVVRVNGAERPYNDIRGLFMGPATVLSIPQHCFPVGFSKAGLPIGAQVMGRDGSDATLLALAADFEDDHAAGLGRRPDL